MIGRLRGVHVCVKIHRKGERGQWRSEGDFNIGMHRAVERTTW